MKSPSRCENVAQSLSLLLASGCLAVATAALAQTETADTITKLTTVDVPQTGKAPTGRYPVVVEHDPKLATHTIYRPSELSMDKHPVLVWGEGGCAKNGLMFPEYLSEIASHGFVVIADGPPVARPAGGPNGPAAGAAPAAGGAGAGGPPPGGAGPPANRASMVNGTALVAALDWLEAESTDRDSRFFDKVRCRPRGGDGHVLRRIDVLRRLERSARRDRRHLEQRPVRGRRQRQDLRRHSRPVIIVTGGESDIAYANGKRDFEVMPAKIPVFTACIRRSAMAALTTRTTAAPSASSPSPGSSGSSRATRARPAAAISSATTARSAKTRAGRSVLRFALSGDLPIAHRALGANGSPRRGAAAFEDGRDRTLRERSHRGVAGSVRMDAVVTEIGTQPTFCVGEDGSVIDEFKPLLRRRRA